jgi:uncharacterized protein YdeI (YjbR/CyaY-like superfamily)
MNSTSVDSYLREGCGRCDLFQTPACKVHAWVDVLEALRAVLLDVGLVETMKWGAPCYMIDGGNVLMLSALRDCATVGFFKGVALPDPAGLLEPPGPNSRYMRVWRVRSSDEVTAGRAALVELLAAAVALERSGTSIEVDPVDLEDAMPEELVQRLTVDEALRRAFDALTPGRQRSHVIYVAGAKQSDARARRVERCAEKIVAGKGYNER